MSGELGDQCPVSEVEEGSEVDEEGGVGRRNEEGALAGGGTVRSLPCFQPRQARTLSSSSLLASDRSGHLRIKGEN